MYIGCNFVDQLKVLLDRMTSAGTSSTGISFFHFHFGLFFCTEIKNGAGGFSYKFMWTLQEPSPQRFQKYGIEKKLYKRYED